MTPRDTVEREEVLAVVERTPGGACVKCNMAAGHDHYPWCPYAALPTKEGTRP